MRASGILMPIFSLASKGGIGTLGKEAFDFVDFLKSAGQTYWQILPLNPTNYGDSPYQSFSASAGNPYFIDIEQLISDGLIKDKEFESADFGNDPARVDYDKLLLNRLPLLKLAYNRFNKEYEGYKDFCTRHSYWLDDYALFMAIKDARGGADWREWEKPLKIREAKAIEAAKAQYADEIGFYKFLQFIFYRQWFALKEYANKKGIKIIGDIPIYVAADSADVWANTCQFCLDEDYQMKIIAGCPPDAFSAEGQLWGMPVYNWELMEKGSVPFSWWRQRMRHALLVYDIVRIDHFRGLESYYGVPSGETTAKNGKWYKGPGVKLFDAIKEDFGGDLPIIAEDLGLITKEVHALRESVGLPGMKVLQFAFDGSYNSDYLPHKHEKNCVVYTGTHDNDTVMGWTKSAPQSDVAFARRYLHVDDAEGFNWAMIRAALMSVADTAIIPMADFMGLDSEARINTPSTVGGNWCWRIMPGCINDWLAGIIYENTALYGRLNKE